jgi:hypothetical protein
MRELLEIDSIDLRGQDCISRMCFLDDVTELRSSESEHSATGVTEHGNFARAEESLRDDDAAQSLLPVE